MPRMLALALALLALWLPAAAAQAQADASPLALAQPGARVLASARWVEEWDPASQSWVRVAESASDGLPFRVGTAPAAQDQEVARSVRREGGVVITETVTSELAPARFIPRAPADLASGPQFGPFRVLDARRAALVGSTDGASPAAFRAMLAAYPGLQVLEFIDAPGTTNDLANLALGRAIRAAGLATHVPAGGSARSGAVELFLAGTRRTIAPGALFAVHSWRDERGREPADFAPDAPENRLYLDYYTEMGMSEAEARAFYAMTNSVPHAAARWLDAAEMARWVAPDAPAFSAPAARDLAPALAAPLRTVLARSGAALTAGVQRPWQALAAAAPAPRLAYASLALLDSEAAFP